MRPCRARYKSRLAPEINFLYPTFNLNAMVTEQKIKVGHKEFRLEWLSHNSGLMFKEETFFI